ncbi:MAG TPA: PEGA domain-containing protein [Myxococcaceae bacterium]|nr:PEGA domain-containing protein [Myxococcaceae bacterium]
MLPLTLTLALTLSAAPAAPPASAPAPAATAKSFLKVEIKPEAAVLYVDGTRRGTGSRPHTLSVEPGRHLIRVVHKGDEHQEEVKVKRGETKVWAWAFEDDKPSSPANEPGGDPEPSLDDLPK